MKRSILFLLTLILAIPCAGELPEYIARYDRHLAIGLYRERIMRGEDDADNYVALARLYDQTGQMGLAEDCYRHLLDLEAGKEGIYREYLGFLYRNHAYGRVRKIILDNGFEEDWSRILLAESYFRDALFDSSLMMAAKIPEASGARLMQLSVEGLNAAQRSPVLGGVMSVLIPGSGKIYAGRWMDGLQAFSMITAPAYNAWYHFSKNGTKSVRAWIWTGVTAWFYLSDIYGSVKAVKEYNDMQKFKIIEKLDP